MNIKIEVIPHSQQRYETSGDWYYQYAGYCHNCGRDYRSLSPFPNPHCQHEGCGKPLGEKEIKKEVVLKISDSGDWRYNMLVAIHELVEVALCHNDGVSQEAVDRFDMKEFDDSTDTEPGDDPNAPYQKQHCFATGVERMVAAAMGVKWAEYEAALETLK